MPPTIASLPDIIKLRDILKEDDIGTWEQAWQAEVTPWDAGDIQPPLQDLIESKEIEFPREGQALVPGCGVGYDAVFIASSLGIKTVGLDVAETAVSAANGYLESKHSSLKTEVKFIAGDFFALEGFDGELFDLVYDHTFFVAIPPSQRPEWGQQMSKLIKPGGYLITLIYPIDPPTDVGPPFFVRPEHYHNVLDGNFIKILDKVPERSSPRHVGKDRMAVWRRC